MSTQTTTSSGGITFFGLLTIVFITLKLTGHISWSWWWVLSPLWFPITVVLGLLGIGYGLYWSYKQIFK